MRSMLKTKTPPSKKIGKLVRTSRSSGTRRVRSAATVATLASRHSSFDSMLRGLKSQIARLTTFIANEPLTREQEIFFISQLHNMNVMRDRMEIMKSGESAQDRAFASRHLGKKMQSSFSRG